MASSYVVDFQGFNLGYFVIKEICVVASDDSFFYHRMVRSPIPYNQLSSHSRKQVNFVTKNIHGLTWDLGYTLEKEVLETLKTKLAGSTVYIKGSERATYLKILLKGRECCVVDLDIFDYRGPRKLKEWRYSCCSKHLYRHSNLRCAFRKAHMYRDYLRNYLG